MYKIITDGSCDLSTERAQELDVSVVPFYVSTDGINHQKEIVELGIRDFYQFMIDNPKVFPKTSMPSIQDYLDVFGPLAKDGIDIICIWFCSMVICSVTKADLSRCGTAS